MNDSPQPRRIAFLLLATLLPGLAAGIAAGALVELQTGVLVGGLAAFVSFIIALVSESEAARSFRTAGELAEARQRAVLEERDSALLEVQTLAAAIEEMDEGMWITDANGVVLRHNEALRTILGTDQELVGQRPLFLVRRTELHDAVLRACREGVTSTVEVSMDAPRSKTLEVHITPLGGSLPGSAAVFRDVTERKRLERVRQDFVANVSHELRTPIAAILGYAETLRSGALSDAAHAPQMVEIIHRQSERLGELVSDLLELSRLDAGERPLSSAPVSLGEVARQASEAMEPRAAGKHLSLQLHVPPDLTARADPKALEQVLLNLLDNAIKYTPEGGTVELVGERVGDRAQLSIKDTGLGIEAKHLPRLFERFYRVDRGRSREQGGTGLGLSIVRHLVHGMEGEVRVASQLGVGSTFTVVLPVG
ncbi:MAG TPA: ATP-binding protein [Myxococcaceae bacterium]|nr:ATP-binding protein [Myxococcaceae bacterium]